MSRSLQSRIELNCLRVQGEVEAGRARSAHGFAGRWSWLRTGLAMVIVGFVISGCGGSDPAKVQLTGTILFDKRPVPPGTLTFVPVDGAGPTATGTISKSGRFTVSTHRPGDGIPPGEYRIRVEAWEIPPTMGGPPPKLGVPARYASLNTTDLVVTIPRDAEQVIEIDLKP